jgi:acetamidase/formamidase
MDYTLEPDDRTLHGYFSPGYEPVLTIDSGSTVTFTTLDDPGGVGHDGGRGMAEQVQRQVRHGSGRRSRPRLGS